MPMAEKTIESEFWSNLWLGFWVCRQRHDGACAGVRGFSDRREPIHGGYTATSLSLSSEKPLTPAQAPSCLCL